MIPSKAITDFSYIVADRFTAINSYFIKIMAQHIRDIGMLPATDLHRLEQFNRMNQNVQEINQLIAQQTNLTLEQLYQVYEKSGISQYKDAAPFYKYSGVEQIPFEENLAIQGYLEGLKIQTRNTFKNLAWSTVQSYDYKTVVDEAITAVTEGVTDFKSVMTKIVFNNPVGSRVIYASGATRRLDSAVRMNILDGMRQLENNINRITGKEFGADGVEIDAHGLCAADHIDIQGKQYSIERFEKINASLRRKISTCNCQHRISYIIRDINDPVYSDKQLDRMKKYSEKSINIGGRDYTRYEVTQLMRQLETKIRYVKDETI